VDLAQAAIGPGMAVYTRYAGVLDAEGNPVTVREALALINQVLDEALAEQEGDFDPDTRWALAWFEQFGFGEGRVRRGRNALQGQKHQRGRLVEAGILESRRGKVRLLKPEELPGDWDPVRDGRFTYWEAVHQLVRRLETGGERPPRTSWPSWEAEGTPPANWPTASTPFASARAGQGGPFLQRPGAELARDRPPEPGGEGPSANRAFLERGDKLWP
jgi:adenine-specific DNA methylase